MKIEEYATGRHMRIAGKCYRSDLKIVGEEVKDNWWRGKGHLLQTDDITDIIDAAPQTLVIGTGYAGRMQVPDKTLAELADRGVQVIAEPTGQAVETFNRLAQTQDAVAGAFHLTC